MIVEMDHYASKLYTPAEPGGGKGRKKEEEEETKQRKSNPRLWCWDEVSEYALSWVKGLIIFKPLHNLQARHVPSRWALGARAPPPLLKKGNKKKGKNERKKEIKKEGKKEK